MPVAVQDGHVIAAQFGGFNEAQSGEPHGGADSGDVFGCASQHTGQIIHRDHIPVAPDHGMQGVGEMRERNRGRRSSGRERANGHLPMR